MQKFFMLVVTLLLSSHVFAQPTSFDSRPCNDLRGICEVRMTKYAEIYLAAHTKQTNYSCEVVDSKVKLGKVKVLASCNQSTMSESQNIEFSAKCDRCTGNIVGKISIK